MTTIPPDVREAIEELKGIVHTRYGGRLPKIQDDPDFYRRLFGVIEAAEAMGIKIPLREVAKMMEVPYATLLARRKEYEKLKDEGVIDVLTGEKSLAEAVQERSEQEGGEEGEAAAAEHTEAEVEGVSKSTEIVIASQLRKHMARKVEELAREEVKEILVAGGYVLQNVKPWCIRRGYEDVRECLREMMYAVEEMEARLADLDARYNACKRMLARLMRLAGDRLAVIDEIKRMLVELQGLTPDERQRILTAVSEAILRLVENAWR